VLLSWSPPFLNVFVSVVPFRLSVNKNASKSPAYPAAAFQFALVYPPNTEFEFVFTMTTVFDVFDTL